MEFFVHESLLNEHSPYFEAKAKPCWKRTESSVDLRDVSVEGFELVVNWIYSEGMPTPLPSSSTDLDSFFKTVRTGYKTADQLLMICLQDQLLEDLKRCLQKSGRYLNLTAASYVIKDDLKHTPLYTFTVKSVVYHLTTNKPNGFEQGLEHLADYPGVLKDILRYVLMFRIAAWQNPTVETGCEFHRHDINGKCPHKKLVL